MEITNGNFCAAKLIEYFKHWTKWKLKTHRTPWIYQSLKNIHADLMGEHSLHVIRDAIAILEDKKILLKRNNPNNKQDKTYQYQINFEELNQLLERRNFQVEHSEFNAETYQQITDPQASDPQKQAAESEKSLEPDWDKIAQQVNQWEQAQLTGETTNFEKPTVTHSVDDNGQDFSTNDLTHHEDASSVPSNEKDSLTNDLISRVDASPVPSNEREEENIKLCEVRDVVGKLTSDLKRLVVNFTLSDLRKALVLYQQRQQKQQIRNPYSWLKKCVEQKWWQDKPANTNAQADARKYIPEPVAASSRLTEEQKAWYGRAIAQGICLEAAIEELPVKMGLVCARVPIPNRRPYDPEFDVFPIEELVARYPFLL
ncbi:MAG: hypothetical protein KME60_34875 [Cyanomargarita calcarea GSE-NOS-MK-12-04C]|uniref:Uncharacterized protein n=1 Tax=Cyanomargarita calcarea GSE-NOS-MK-12-04C TaxID=2839659 RepID=A0A951UX20_9CYAN|nr:hypothetical protein [Cyanomargarita calcarea GSE-NOS-MK-12-04C]